MAEGELSSLKGSPCNHSDIMQKLYAELDQEREASATAANEALSMILRLQGERSAEKMEACQYKRMTEEKIHHAEKSLANFEEVLHQKDMEISYLKFQVQIYRDRLSKTTTSGPSLMEVESLETSSSRSNTSLGDMCFHGAMRRNSTLPTMRFQEKCYEMDISNEELISHLNGKSDLAYFDSMNIQENVGGLYDMLPELSEESPFFKFHCDRIEEKCIKMKEAANSRRIEDNLQSDSVLLHHEIRMSMPVGSLSSGLGNRPYTSHSTASNDRFYISAIEMEETIPGASSLLCSQSECMKNLQDFCSQCCSYFESELPVRTAIHSSVSHDIFEVPQSAKVYNNAPKNKLLEDCLPEREDVPLTMYSVPKGALHCSSNDEEWINKTLLTGQSDTTAPKLGAGLDCSCTHKKPKGGEFFPHDVAELWQYDLKQLKKQVQVLEDDRMIMKRESSAKAEEQLKLLREISVHLSMIHTFVKRPLKRHRDEDDAVVSVMEAMLSFLI